MPDLNTILANLGLSLVNLVVALIILLVGYIIARIIANIVRRLLRRTNLDNRLADSLSEPEERRDIQVEDVIAKITFWILMLFVFVAFFERLNLTGLAAPITSFLEQLTSQYLPRLFAAGVTLFVAWLVASALRFLVKKTVSLTKLDENLSKHAALEEGEQVSFGENLANATFWFILLLFLPSVLSTLGLEEIAKPVSDVFLAIFNYLPNIFGALIILAIGWFIARVVRQIVANLLKSIGTDQVGYRAGMSEERSLSDLVAMLLYIFILVVAIIASLDALDIAAITVPATQMLNTIINVIPNLIGAALLLIIAYAIAKLVANLVRDLLGGLGFDTIPPKLGLKWSRETSPSQWVAYLTLFAIMLFATVGALEMLQAQSLVVIMNVFIAFFWKVVLAVVIFAIGLYLAGIAYKGVLATGTNQSNFIGRVAQMAIIVFAAAISLRTIGVADDIINLAFGITLAALGLAVALSLGLGTTKISEREVDKFISVMREPQDED
jgi:hypothetical protein